MISYIDPKYDPLRVGQVVKYMYCNRCIAHGCDICQCHTQHYSGRTDGDVHKIIMTAVVRNRVCCHQAVRKQQDPQNIKHVKKAVVRYTCIRQHGKVKSRNHRSSG